MKMTVVPRILRDLTGVLLVGFCAVLILFFGLVPLMGLKACPVLRDKDGSAYRKGSLAFMRETDPSKLKTGDVVFYYDGTVPVGLKVTANDQAGGVVTTDSGKTLSYRKISGKGSFSVPVLGRYANWLTAGRGLKTSVIVMGVVFAVFAVSAFMVRYKDES